MYEFDDLKQAGVDVEAGMEFTGKDEKYLSAIQRFYKSYEGNSAKIKQYFEEKDLMNYSITVHAIKSNAKMIGAKALSELALELELASKNSEVETVDAKTDNFLAEYKKLIDLLQKYGEMERVKAPGELDGEEARAVVEELLAALDDFDDDKAAELADKLRGYPFRITQKQLLKDAIDSIENFMYDEAADIIRILAKNIE